MDDHAAELTELFAPNGTLDPEILIELQSILRLSSLTPQELFFKWESYILNMRLEDSQIRLKTVQDLKKHIQDSIERESRVKTKDAMRQGENLLRTPLVSRTGRGADMLGMLDELSPGMDRYSSLKRKANFTSPLAKTPRNAGLPSPRPGGFGAPIPMSDLTLENRANSGKTVDSLNAHIPLPPSLSTAVQSDSAPISNRIKLKAFTDLSKFGYKTMSMKLPDVAEILDDRIDEFSALVQEECNLDDDAFGNPATQSPNEIVVVGRIVSDNPVGTKLSSSSLMIETSQSTGSGLRVPLNVSALLGKFEFFPGKIVALRGSNPSGETFVVKEEIPLPDLLHASSLPREIDGHIQHMATATGSVDPDDAKANPSSLSPLNIVIASGPFTPSASLDFSVFTALLNTVRSSRADCLLLSGPFIDIDHPSIRVGDFDLPDSYPVSPDKVTLLDLFRYHISSPLAQLCQEMPYLTVILCPSVRDAASRHVCWPQDRFSKKELGLPKGVTTVANPVTLGLNEAVFGISSQDVLDALRLTECVGDRTRADGEHVFARLAQQVINQRHFFPVFPPPAAYGADFGAQNGDGVAEDDMGLLRFQNVGTMLDTPYLKLAEWPNILPDVLICPSVLPPFAKVVQNVVVINPGPLVKAKSPGTYARMILLPYELSPEEREDEEGRLTHAIYERARVDIIRI